MPKMGVNLPVSSHLPPIPECSLDMQRGQQTTDLNKVQTIKLCCIWSKQRSIRLRIFFSEAAQGYKLLFLSNMESY